MNKSEFISVLKEKGIAFEEKNGKIIINHNGRVHLENIISLPKNIEFNGNGRVHLENVTYLPKNIKFNHRGYVNLQNVISLSETTQFNNFGDVILDNVISLPKNIKFNNESFVFLGSLNSIDYLGKQYELIQVDDYTMIVHNRKMLNEIEIINCSYFMGRNIDERRNVFVVKKGEYTARGETEEEAIECLKLKEN